MINKLSKEIHQNAKEHGFFDDKKNIGEMLALIHSEVSEALECDRKDKYYSNCIDEQKWFIDGMAEKYYGHTFNDDSFFEEQFEKRVKDTFEDELADIMIRVMDLAAFKEVNLENHIKAKMRYNAMRPHKHGKKY